MIEQRTFVVAGYDDKRGFQCDEWVYAVIDRDSGAALTLNVSTPYYPPTVTLGRRKFEGACLVLCVAHQTSAEQIRTAAQPSDCEYLGKCYLGSVWGLLADELVTTHFDPCAMTIDYPQPKLWTSLATFLVLQITKLDAERQEAGDLGWVQCTACCGNGVVARKP